MTVVATRVRASTVPRHDGQGILVAAEGRIKPTESHAIQVRVRRGLGLAIALHVAALAGLMLIHPVLKPDADVAAYDIVVMTAEPPEEKPVPEPATSPEPPAATEPEPPPPTAAEPPPPTEPEPPPPTAAEPPPPPAVAEPEPPPPPPPTVAETEPPPAPVILEPTPPTPPPPQPPPRQTLRPPPPQKPPHAPAARHEVANAVKPNADPAPESKTAALPPAAPQPQATVDHPSPAWLAGVDKWLLDHRFYPEMARRQGREGTVVVRFTADHDGHVLAVALVRSSGSDALDEAAQTLVRGARLPPFPPDMTMSQQSIAVSIRYRLD